MKKKSEQIKAEDDTLLPEYDFTGKKGVRGKYYRAYRQGHTVKVHKADGTVSIRYFTLAEGAVMLEPDVREYFPSSESVNNALRSLIALKPTRSTKPAKRGGRKKFEHAMTKVSKGKREAHKRLPR